MKKTQFSNLHDTDFSTMLADFLFDIEATDSFVQHTFRVGTEIDPATREIVEITLTQANFVSCFCELVSNAPSQAALIAEIVEELRNRWQTSRFLIFALTKFYLTVKKARRGK